MEQAAALAEAVTVGNKQHHTATDNNNQQLLQLAVARNGRYNGVANSNSVVSIFAPGRQSSYEYESFGAFDLLTRSKYLQHSYTWYLVVYKLWVLKHLRVRGEGCKTTGTATFR